MLLLANLDSMGVRSNSSLQFNCRIQVQKNTGRVRDRLPDLSPLEVSPWDCGPRIGRTYVQPILRTRATIWFNDGQESVLNLGQAHTRPAERAALAALGSSQRPLDVRFHDLSGGLVGSTVTWKGELFPGEKALIAVTAGGRMQVFGPGEVADVPIASAGWVLIEAPRTSELTAAQEGCEKWTCFAIEGAIEGAWEGRRLPRGNRAAEAPPAQSGAVPPDCPLAEVLVAMRECAIVTPPGLETQTDEGQRVGDVTPSADQNSLGSWIARGLSERATVESGPAEDEGTVNDTLLAAARAALGRFSVQEEVHIDASARWIGEHVRNAPTRGPVRSWQWAFTICAWVLERAGLPELMSSDRGRGEELLAQAGFCAQACRQRPCSD